MSRRSRYAVSFVDDIVLSVISLVWNICSVVDLFLRYAAWGMGIAESNLKLILFIIQTANIVLSTGKGIIGRRFDVSPFGFPGFCSCFKNSACDFIWVLSCGCNIDVYICDFFYTTSGEYFINSMLIWSIPGLLLFFRVDTVFLISDDKNVVNIGVGNTLVLRKKIIWKLRIARVVCRAFSIALSNLEFTIWITPYGPRASGQIFSSVWRVRNTSTQVKT